MALNKKLSYRIFIAVNVFLSLFFLLSVYSYSPDDPTYSNIVFSQYDTVVKNLFGKCGAYFADFFSDIFGWSSVLMPILFLIVLFRIFKGINETGKSVWSFFVDTVSILFIIGFLSLLSGFFKGKDIVYNSKNMGGIIGVLASDFLESLFGLYGGVVLSLFCILFSILIFFRNTEKIYDLLTKPVVWMNFLRGKFKKKPQNSENKKPQETAREEMIPYSKVIDVDTKETPVVNTGDTTVKINEIATFQKEKRIAYQVPISLLDSVEDAFATEDETELRRKGKMLEEKFMNFGIEGKIKEIQPGPVVTLYEFEPAPGIKVSKIASLEDDLALAMSAISVRIIAPIPGKSVVGIELPNKKRAAVSLKELIMSSEFGKSGSFLTVILGKDISGKPYLTDLSKMPHLLIAGTTGSGKSVSINTIICSILYKSSPDMVKFVMIDPKMVELSSYEDIPHLAAPVVVDPRKASTVLKNVVLEMENRYSILAELKVRNIDSYNELAKTNKSIQKMHYMVVVVDEFADLMIVAGKEVEQSIIRIAQMARAVGIHLILATQRPSVNVITGIIKANMPARLSFRVSSKTDSRTILDQNGAEMLLGRGDSLFIPPGTSDPVRIHGCFVSESEVAKIVEFLKTLGKPDYNMDLLKEESENIQDVDEAELDEKYYEALELVKEKGMASISMIQRYLRIGYNRAARIVEIMEKQGVIGPSDGTSKPREVVIKER